jgi:hypothetical protein
MDCKLDVTSLDNFDITSTTTESQTVNEAVNADNLYKTFSAQV